MHQANNSTPLPTIQFSSIPVQIFVKFSLPGVCKVYFSYELYVRCTHAAPSTISLCRWNSSYLSGAGNQKAVSTTASLPQAALFRDAAWLGNWTLFITQHGIEYSSYSLLVMFLSFCLITLPANRLEEDEEAMKVNLFFSNPLLQFASEWLCENWKWNVRTQWNIKTNSLNNKFDFSALNVAFVVFQTTVMLFCFVSESLCCSSEATFSILLSTSLQISMLFLFSTNDTECFCFQGTIARFCLKLHWRGTPTYHQQSKFN